MGSELHTHKSDSELRMSVLGCGGSVGECVGVWGECGRGVCGGVEYGVWGSELHIPKSDSEVLMSVG